MLPFLLGSLFFFFFLATVEVKRCTHFPRGFHRSVLHCTPMFRNTGVGIEQIVPSSLPVRIPGLTTMHFTERGRVAEAGLVWEGDTGALALDILRLEIQEKLESI